MNKIVAIVSKHLGCGSTDVNINWIPQFKEFGVSANVNGNIAYIVTGKNDDELLKALKKKFGRKKN